MLSCSLNYAGLLKNKEVVCQLCVEILSQGHPKHLNLDTITVGQSVIETLTYVISRV